MNPEDNAWIEDTFKKVDVRAAADYHAVHTENYKTEPMIWLINETYESVWISI